MFKKILQFINNKKLVLLGLFLLGAASYFGYQNLVVSQEEELETFLVKRQDLDLTVFASGEVESDEQATLKFQTSGELAWVGVKEGDTVDKWQAIASLNQKKLEKELRQELIDYQNERWDFEQTTLDDYQDQALTETIRRAKEKAQFDLNQVVLDVEIADIALKYANLYTPIAGIVTQVEAPHPGVNITPATAEFVIANPQKMVFVAKVDEVDIGKVKKGQPGTIILDAYPDEKLKTKATQVDFTSTTTSGGGTAFGVKFELPTDNRDQKFKLGMNGDVNILIEKKSQILTVPFQAVQEGEDGFFVWLLEDGQPKKQAVETGFSSDLDTQITKGIEEGDLVITSGFDQLSKIN